jgi:hypothetical protein
MSPPKWLSDSVASGRYDVNRKKSNRIAVLDEVSTAIPGGEAGGCWLS